MSQMRDPRQQIERKTKGREWGGRKGSGENIFEDGKKTSLQQTQDP